jgi:hypothetical protein
MSKFETVEQVYQELAASCVDFAGGRQWDLVVCEAVVLGKMARTHHVLSFEGSRDGDGLGWPDLSISPGAAALFLRDDLLQTTGQRIWGLTFTLFPDGQFKIEYDYNKPEGYEESDEVITGDEINASLAKLTGQDSKPS